MACYCDSEHSQVCHLWLRLHLNADIASEKNGAERDVDAPHVRIGACKDDSSGDPAFSGGFDS